MIDILKEKQNVIRMKASPEKQARNSVLNEVRTREMLEKNPTIEKQYKWFEHAYKTRTDAAYLYKENNRMDLYEKEERQFIIAQEYMNILKKSMPEQLSEDEVKNIIIQLKTKAGLDFNIGSIMKYFSKEYPNQNKSMISKIFKNI